MLSVYADLSAAADRDGGLRRRAPAHGSRRPAERTASCARRPAARSVRLEHVLVRRQHREGGDHRAGARLGHYLDRRVSPSSSSCWLLKRRLLPRAGDAGGAAVVDRSAGGARRPRARRGAGSRGDWPRRLCPPTARPRGLKERAASRLERIEAAAGRGNDARHRHSRDDRRDRALRRPVRHGLGHHEQLYRHLEGADHQPRRRRAGHRRGAARHRASASSPRSRPSCSTTCWRDTRPAAGR